jgi:hypothetical protein
MIFLEMLDKEEGDYYVGRGHLRSLVEKKWLFFYCVERV